jgi:peptidyl-prolyl cis-trans isomerase C
MNSFKNILITIAVVLLIAGVAEAKKKEKAPKAPAAEPNISAEQPKPKAAEPNTLAVEPNQAANSKVVAVTVNSTKITEGQINKMLDTRMTQLAGRIPPNMQDQYRQQMRKRIVEQLVIEEILAQKEKEKKITVAPAELQEQINKQLAQQNLTIDEFKSLLKAYGTTYSEYEENMLKKAMFEKLMEGEFASKIIKPTDEQIKTYYTENAPMFSEPEKIHTRHILIMPAKDSNDPNQIKSKAKAKAKAEDILVKLKAGADFNDLAKQDSNCPSAKEGGDLGSQPKGTFVPEFEKAAYALKPGQMSDVVETQFGYHIIKLVDHNDASTTSLEQAKDRIVQTLTDKQKGDIVMNYIQQIKKEAKITFVNPADNFEPTPPKTAPPARTGSPRSEAGKNEPNQPKGEVSPKADSKK